MALFSRAVCFLDVSLRPISIRHIQLIDMKKILLLIAAVGLIMSAISCSDNDEPQRGDGVFTVNTTMVNHMVNTSSNQVLGISTTQNKLVIDTVNHKATVELRYDDGQGVKTLYLSDIKATAKRLGFYELTSTSDGSFSGYVDFNEGSIRYRYTTGGIRVISTTPEVFFLKTQNTITYDDTTQATTMENVMYQFEIAPATQTAIIKVMGIVHAKDVKYFNSITANNVPYTVTPNGFTISGENLKTSAYYRTYVDTTGSVVSQTDKYPFKTFNATVDMVGDHLDANYMIGASATVVASGKTYPDYTSY